MARIGAFAVSIMLFAACSGSHGGATKPIATTTTGPRLVPHVCDLSDAKPGVRQLESSAGRVWVWIESAAGRRFRVGSLVKVVWRITGTGEPRTVLTDPYGRDVKLSFGPELHGASTFVHPGAEYGTGFVPKVPGCWQFGMRRGPVEGWASLTVVR